MKKRPRFTNAIKQEFFIYLSGFLDGHVASSGPGKFMISMNIFSKSIFFKRYYKELLTLPSAERKIQSWLLEFANSKYWQ